jgi:hypothetical protein
MPTKQTDSQEDYPSERTPPTSDPRDANASLGDAVDAVGCGSGIDLGGTGSGIVHVRHGPGGTVSYGEGEQSEHRGRAERGSGKSNPRTPRARP